MRSLTLPAFAFVLAACSSSAAESPSPLPATDDPGRVSHDAAPGIDPSRPASPPQPITVTGSVINNDDQPAAHHKVMVLDSTGKRFEGETDAGGHFVIPGVLPPYDLSTQRSDTTNALMVHLGVKSPDRVLRVFNGALPVTQPDATAQIAFYVVPCPSASCTYQIVTTSAHGGGNASWVATDKGITGKAVSVSHHFSSAVAASEDARVDMLVSASDGTKFWYVQDAVVVTPGQLTYRTVQPRELSSPTSVSITIADQKTPPDWKRQTGLQLEVSSRIWFYLSGDTDNASRITFPLLAGATTRVNAYAYGPQTTDEQWSFNGSKVIPPSSSAATVQFDLSSDLELETPRSLQMIPASTPTYSWKRTRNGEVRVDLYRSDYATGSVMVLTDESHLDLARLEALGMAKLTAGEYFLGLSSYADATVDKPYDASATAADDTAVAYHAVKFTLQ